MRVLPRILPVFGAVRTHSIGVEMIVTELRLARHEHRHQIAETLFQRRVVIDIDHLDGKAQFTPQEMELIEHLIAEMTVAAPVERERARVQGRYSCNLTVTNNCCSPRRTSKVTDTFLSMLASRPLN